MIELCFFKAYKLVISRKHVLSCLLMLLEKVYIKQFEMYWSGSN